MTPTDTMTAAESDVAKARAELKKAEGARTKARTSGSRLDMDDAQEDCLRARTRLDKAETYLASLESGRVYEQERLAQARVARDIDSHFDTALQEAKNYVRAHNAALAKVNEAFLVYLRHAGDAPYQGLHGTTNPRRPRNSQELIATAAQAVTQDDYAAAISKMVAEEIEKEDMRAAAEEQIK